MSSKNVFSYSAVSLYPTANALDEYAVGCKKQVKMTLDDLKDVRSRTFAKVL